jgi:hypothetical protein
MSYSCTYYCFDKKLADTKWQAEDLSKLRNYEDEELMMHDLELGSAYTVTLSKDVHISVVDVMKEHGIEVVDFPTLDNIQKLLASLDVSKVRKALLSENVGQYEPEMRNGFDLVLEVVKEIAGNQDSEDTVYSINGIEKYATSLFEACGIFLYSTVSKDQVATFNDQFSQEIYEKALVGLLDSYEKAITENHKYAQQDLIAALKGLKEIVQILNVDSELELVFTDDGTDLPELFQNRLIEIKTKF